MRKFLRWTLFLACIGFGLAYLNSAAFSAWVAAGPPTDYPALSTQQALIKLGYAIGLFSTGILFFKALKEDFKFSNSKIIYLWAFGVLVSIGLPEIREFIMVDICLDNGGRWEANYFECSY